MILNYLVEVVWLLISWCYAHSLSMKYVWVVFLFAQLVVRTHWTKPAHTFTLFVSSFPLQPISFLSATPVMLLGLCSFLTIALSFPVSGKYSFAGARWCNEKGVNVGVWRPDLSLGAISYCLRWPRFIVSSVKKGLWFLAWLPLRAFVRI